MALPEIRPATDPLTTLEKHIQQSEDAGGNLETVVAGHQNGKDFNFVSFTVPEGANQQPPKVTLILITAPVDTTDQMDAVRTNIEAQGKTLLFLAPIFDAGTQKMVAVCRDGPVVTTMPVGGVAVNVPAPGGPPGVAIQATMSIQPDPTSGSFHGNSSHTTGLAGTTTTYADGTVVRDEYGNSDRSSERKSRSQDSAANADEKGRCGTGAAGRVLLVTTAATECNSRGKLHRFPTGKKFVTGKASEFGKHDTTDEGTGSELLKVVQTNSEIFGCSLKESILTAAFGTPLKNKPELLRAQVEIFNPDPKHKKFARVPIVDVGPREDLKAVIDLTFQLDKFLGTDGSAKVQFRIVV